MACELQSGGMRKCQCLQEFEGEIFPLIELTLFYQTPSCDMINNMLINIVFLL